MGTNAADRSGRGWGAAWNRFWFTPADPTVLALIRIFCGLITFYTLAACTPDLDDLLGANAWVDLPTRQMMYRYSPSGGGELGWTSYPFAPAPQTQAEQQYWDSYIAKWKVPPPGPYPKSEAEVQWIDGYITRWSVDPRTATSYGRNIWSIWFHVTDPGTMRVVHYAFLACALLLTLGLATRLTAVVTWFAALSFSHRATTSVFGVDTMNAVLLLYLMIGPSGAALSLDRVLARWWARVRPRAVARWHALFGRTVPVGPPRELPPPAPSVSCNVVIRLLQLHVCVIYMSAGLAKLQGQTWWTGMAVWGTIANFEFAPMQYDWYVTLLRWLTANRVVFEVVMTAGGLFTLAFEIGYAFLVWRPGTRWVMLGGAVVLHGLIGLFMGLKTFALMMLTMNLAFVPPETAKRWLRKLTGGWYRDAEAPPPPQPPSVEREKAALGAAAGRAR